MDIQVTSTGKIFYQVDSTLAAILCEVLPEAVKRVERPAPVVPSARWTNSVTTGGYKFIQVSCPKCHRDEQFSGRAEDIPEFESRLCVHAGKCPDDVRKVHGDGGVQLLGAQFK